MYSLLTNQSGHHLETLRNLQSERGRYSFIALLHDKAASMIDPYEPASQFLQQVGSGSVPLTGSAFAEANLRRLIEFTRDDVLSNRDWAVFLLSHADVDTAEARAALHDRLYDESQVVQEEAMVGLSIRQDASALPIFQSWMRSGRLSVMILEAAAEFAVPSLCQLLGEQRNLAEDLALKQIWQEAWKNCNCTPMSEEKRT